MNPYRPTRTIPLVAAALVAVALGACAPDDTAAEALSDRAPATSVELGSDARGSAYDCQRVRSGSYC